ncbi:MAG: hypothetical protein HY800_05250 [Ignavibacteriales bacterium]|nr:hypothetical protein [Ignavibacteriales bacterium]
MYRFILLREVAALVNGVMQPGLYDVEWDAHNAPNGVYYYRLSTETFVETKKCVVLR